MALIFCPECGTQVSEHAQDCMKCAYPINKRKIDSTESISIQNPNFMSDSTKKTDLFAIISFASGLGGFLILPILFVPIGYIAAIASYYRLKENNELQGHGLRIIGAILTSINILWLMYQYKIGFFSIQ